MTPNYFYLLNDSIINKDPYIVNKFVDIIYNYSNSSNILNNLIFNLLNDDEKYFKIKIKKIINCVMNKLYKLKPYNIWKNNSSSSNYWNIYFNEFINDYNLDSNKIFYELIIQLQMIDIK